MPHAISLKTTGNSSAPLRKLWETYAELESVPSMQALGYPPHLTLAVYEDMSKAALLSVKTSVFQNQVAVTLTFDAISVFSEPDFVVWASPAQSLELRRLHSAIHELIAPESCRHHYRPESWVPHATLATGIGPESQALATRMASAPLEPFEVVFNAADLVEFIPVRIVKEVTLHPV